MLVDYLSKNDVGSSFTPVWLHCMKDALESDLFLNSKLYFMKKLLVVFT